MFKELKLKIAARRVERKKARKTVRNKRKSTSFWGRIWDIICRPFRFVAKMARKLWAWIRSLDLIGLVNLTLLIAIIVLFSMLIIDIVGCRQKSVVIVSDAPAIAVEATRPQIMVTNDLAPNEVQKKIVRRPTLPLRRDAATRKFIDAPVSVVKPCGQKVASQKIQGDVMIDRSPASPRLSNGVVIYGNLYLQNMRKYTLPCGTVIHGNMFLRDVDMLQFCGDFTVTGNIYVSPRSSFGPIPSTARLGGQVIL